jgi:hypothetical protein
MSGLAKRQKANEMCVYTRREYDVDNFFYILEQTLYRVTSDKNSYALYFGKDGAIPTGAVLVSV